MPTVHISCAQCGVSFDSGGNVLRRYCSLRCRARANRRRERETRGGPAAVAQSNHHTRVAVDIFDSTAELLAATAEIALAGKLPAPVLFSDNEAARAFVPEAGIAWDHYADEPGYPPHWRMF